MAYAFSVVSQPQITLFSPQTADIKKHFFHPTHIKIKTKTTIPNNCCLRGEKESIFPAAKENSQFFNPIVFIIMGWTQLRAAIGQRFNLEGIIFSSNILAKQPQMLVPHIKVPNIRYINWKELHNRGFKGVVFDKDNTITLPYSLNPHDPLKTSLDNCKSIFGEENVAVLSNSVGLFEYDPDETKADAVERELGIRVIRHKVKKPAGNAEEIEQQFGCQSMEIIMVGDRRFTDIVYGNKNGFLTVLTEPLTGKGENFVVKLVRKLEDFVVGNRFRRGLQAKNHCFLDNSEVNMVCLNEPL